MVFAAIVFFMLAVLIGIVLITYVWQGKKVPRILSLTHGFFASLGLIFVLISAFSQSVIWGGASVLLLAATGGLYLFSQDLKKRKLPKLIATLHGLTALLGLTILIITVFVLYT